MIITTNELLNSGLPISTEIDTPKLEAAIHTAEHFIIKPRLGNKYIDITQNPAQYSTILNGGIVTDEQGKEIAVAGLKRAEIQISFAILLRDNLNTTVFGSVLKKDEFSDQADESKIRTVGQFHIEVGMQYLKEITDYFKIKNNGDLPNIYLSEYI